ALADRLVHQATVGEARLREDRADGWRRIDAVAWAERRLRIVEHFCAGAETAIARRGGLAVGLLQHSTELHRELDEGPHMRQPLAFVGVEQRVGGIVLDD